MPNETKGIVIDDREFYEELVSSHARALYQFAYRLCGTKDKADDLVQETMYHAWRSISSLRDKKRGRAWLLQILRNRYKHLMRTQSRRIKTDADAGQIDRADEQAGEDLLAKISNQELLQRSLDSLEDCYKEPFLLVFMQDMTCRETAEFLDLPLGTVLSRIHRARIQLRRQMQHLDPMTDVWTEPAATKESKKDSRAFQHELRREDE